MKYTASTIAEAYQARFHEEPLVIRAPGRINIIGEHTDYNDGWVMPAAIDMDMLFAFGEASSDSSITSLNLNQTFTFSSKEEWHPIKENEWTNYLLGIVARLHNLGYEIKPFHCVLGSNIPTGAGVSSSAALECGFVFGLAQINNLSISRIEMAKIAQWSDHHFVGVQSGIMDQFASLMGKEDHVILLDCRSHEFSYLPLYLENHSLILLDTGVKHSLASSEYNLRRKECAEGVEIVKKKFPETVSLRDATLTQLEECKKEMSEVVYNRCRYILSENERVMAARQDMEKGDLAALGRRISETHEGLSLLYNVSCRELDFLVAEAHRQVGVLGARMMGGGFGGCTINLVEKKNEKAFVEHMRDAYKEFGHELNAFAVKIKNGVERVANAQKS